MKKDTLSPDHKEKYRLHAKLPVYRRRVERAKSIILESLGKEGTWTVSYSGGKDSMALLGLLLECGWQGPLFHFYYAETPTENTEMARRMANRYNLEIHLLSVPGAWDVFREVGRFFVYPETIEEKKAVNRMLVSYKRLANEYADKQRWHGQFLGMRKAESRSRSMTLNKKGYLYRTKDRSTWTCCPLADWKAEDVWAYILQHDLPYLETYAKAEDPERERSEFTWLAAESLWRYGMAARLKKDRPEEFEKLCTEWPEIRNYT